MHSPTEGRAHVSSSDALLGVPDRSSSASAPPDLEISSRSLFAFKADYSGIFSDIRMDEDYEGFYYDNPERTKLPPPLQPRRRDVCSPPHLPPRPPPATTTPPPPSTSSYSSSLNPHQPSQLRRDDSDKSFDDLIYRDSRSMMPLSASQTYRGDESFQHHSQPRNDHQFQLPSTSSPTHHSSSSAPQHTREPPATNTDHFHTSSPRPLPHLSSPTARKPQHSEPLSLQNDQQLWKLRQLSLNDPDDVQRPSPLYPTHHSYDPQQQVPTSFAQPHAYAYRQPHSPSAVAAAAASAAAAAASVQHSSGSYTQRGAGDAWIGERGRKGFYEGRDSIVGMGSSYLAPNTAMADMFAAGLEESLLPYEAQAAALSYGNGGYAVARNLFSGQGAGAGGRVVRNGGRSGGGGVDGYGYYGSGGGGGYGEARGRAIAMPSEYLNAQAAAAAAAAAAAVYQSNGVHINGNGGFAPLRTGGGVGRSAGRNGGRIGDVRRGNGSLVDGYARGVSTGAHGAAVGRNGGGALVDRSGASGADGGANLKFSSFNDVIGRAEELARDQHGCRFLQTKLEEGNASHINSIFQECYEKFVELMTDPFGNYLCQKLFEFCNDAQRLALVQRCAPAIPLVSVNMHGTRAVQRMVECLSTAEQVKAVCEALKPAAVSLMKDINGNHVIQRCLNRMEPVDNQFVYDAVADNCFELATHRHGCCVMQRCMDFASPMQKNQLAQQINANALPLVQNAFGNYVVQYVLELNDPVYTEEIIQRLRGHLAELSMQKFSSNVVEKGLQLSSRDTRRELIDELISDQDTMRRLLHDAYGNYVIQRALQIAEGPQLEAICEAIRPHLHSLKQSPYGKRIQAKILKRMPKGIPPLPPTG